MKCFDKGLKIKEGVDKWAAFSDIIKDIEATAIELQSSAQIQEVMNIRNFIHMEDEDIHDSDEDLTDQIADYYNLKPDEDSQEVPIVVAQVSISEAITALNTLRLYQEQKVESNNQAFLTSLRQELRGLEVKRMNSQRQTTLQQWFC